MSFAIERSQSPPRNGLSAIFSKSRSRGKDSEGNSTKSMESSENPGMRSSLEKVKSRTPTEEDSDHSGLMKLMPKSLTSKRRRKKLEREEERRMSEEAARGRSVAERGTLSTTLERSYTQGSGDGSSFIAYDSDAESPLESPPPLSQHPSHIGYLTTSSPLVQSTLLPEGSLSEPQLDGATGRNLPLPFPAENDVVAASISTPSLVDSSLRAPENGSYKRSPSPVGRLKDALRPRRSAGPSPNTSPERKSVGAGVDTQKERHNVGEGERGSVASRISSIFPDRHTTLQPTSASPSTVSSPERRRPTRVQAIDTSTPPRTPPSGDNTAPIIVNTPPTPTEHSSPRFSTRERGTSDPVVSNPNVITSPSGNMISHRRIRSGSASLGPSKLSNITSAPLTPTPEYPSTPGQGGFFSTVFSAAQNAANTLSNSIANSSVTPNGSRSRIGTPDIKGGEDPEVEPLVEKQDSDNPSDEKELAVKTLGMGDLNLSHLGISEPGSGTTTPFAARFPDENRGRPEPTNEDSFNRAVTAPPVSAADVEYSGLNNVDEFQPLARPRSMYYEPSMGGQRTPPNGSVFEGRSGLQRSGSIRSVIGHRKRGSSTATGTTIGAAIAAANTSIANPNSGQPKLTGFAVASKKRNRDFHQLFRSVPDDDYLIEDYSCALQREILAHGRLYVSEGHLCFSSNIFGWVTTLVMSFDEIVSVEKRSTALLFKNGLMISTLHAKNIFASFTSRDSTYELIVGIWKLGHPSLRSSLNGVRIEETGGGDKTEKDDGTMGSQSGSSSGSDSDDGDEVYDEDEEEEDGMSFTQAEGSFVESDTGDRVVSRKPSAAVVSNGAPAEKSKEDGAGGPAVDFPGPATHAPTECTDHDTHYPKVLADDIIPAPLGKVYSLVFGPASLTWMRNLISVEQKCLELTMDGQKPLGLDNRVRTYSYIRPLNGAIGPKQTKCMISENLDSLDYEKAASVTITTQTPDVPSGNVFSIKTKYCFTWAEGNNTRLQMNCGIEWTGKSWLKGPIEKGANDGQVQYGKDIVAALKAAVSSRRGTVPAAVGKGKKKSRKSRESKSIGKTTDGATDTKPPVETWGLLEPVHGILRPIVDIIKPLLTGNILYGILVGLLVASWFRFGSSGGGGGDSRLGMGYFNTPEKVAAYEEIWRREESELWNWLDDRVGMDRLRDVGRMPIEVQAVQDRLSDDKMDEREVDAAIRVTEEKLRVLKAAVANKKEDSRAAGEKTAGKSKSKPRSGTTDSAT